MAAKKVLRKKPNAAMWEKQARERQRPVLKKAEAKDARDRTELAKATSQVEKIAKLKKQGFKEGPSIGGKLVKAVVENVTAERKPAPLSRSQVKAGEKAAKTNPKVRAYVRNNPGWRKGPELAKGELQAPVLKVLEQTTRVQHGLAGLSQEGLKGGKKGLINNKRYSFVKTAKNLGAGNTVAQIVGNTANVVADPVTWTTLGSGTVAKQAAQQSARAAVKRAARAGVSEAGQATVAKQAAKKAAAAAPVGKGVTVKFGGKEVPGVRRGTAAVGRKIPKPKGDGGRELLREIRPDVAPKGASKEEFQAGRHAARGVKAEKTREGNRSLRQAEKLARDLKPNEYGQVISAIEHGTIGKLPEHLRDAAVVVRSSNRHALRLRKRAGKVGDTGKAKADGAAKEYVTHAHATPLKKGKGIKKDTPGYGDDAGKHREDKRPIDVQNPERVAAGKEPFSTDLPLLHANYQRATANVSGNATLEREIGEAGTAIPVRVVEGKTKAGKKVFKRTADVSKKKDGQTIYHLSTKKGDDGGRYKLREWEEGTPVPKDGKLVALDPRNVEAAREYGQTYRAESKIGRGIDKGTRLWKGAAIATPGYYARNAIGDPWLGYLNQSGFKLPGNMAQGFRASREVGKRRWAKEDFKAGRSSKTIPLSEAGARVIAKETGKPYKGRNVPMDDFLDVAEKHGVTQAGQISGELAELSNKAGGPVRKVKRKGRPVHKKVVSAIGTGRENAVRLGTFRDGINKGMSGARATDHAMGPHIDYNDLTRLEKKYGRRAAPFFTFTARALPFQTKRLVTNPGKFATLQKAREAAEGEDGNLDDFSEYTQRQAPFKIGGKAVSAGLPVSLLNELPADPKKYPEELYKFGISMSHPLPKTVLELFEGKTFGFRRELEPEHAPNVTAPGWVALLPADLKKKAGVKRIVDKRTGKETWGWPGKVDHFVRQAMPGMGTQINSLSTEGSNKVAQNLREKIIGGATGVRIVPADKPTQDITRLYKKRDAASKARGGLRQTKAYEDREPAAIERDRKLSLEIRTLEREILKASIDRGDVKPLQGGGRRVVKKKGGLPVVGGGKLPVAGGRLPTASRSRLPVAK